MWRPLESHVELDIDHSGTAMKCSRALDSSFSGIFFVYFSVRYLALKCLVG